MKIGTYYYPEQWPREQWERDFDHIASMGLQIVHLGEFAWFSLEPKPGDFQFGWLERCLELAAARKLEVILCTPTASPPIWLSHESPESLPVNQYGLRALFGGRRHYTPTSISMREATKRIVTALAERFGNHPSVIGWQIDNEYGNEHGEFDQSEPTQISFRQWLSRKYSTIDALNKAWGTQFWNTYYTSFDQISMPRTRDLNYANPHHLLDAQRFWSWAFADFNKLQADILRPRVGNRFITTNFMAFHPTCDPKDMAPDLSLIAWDSYPVTGWEKNITDETHRIADPAGISFLHEMMSSYNGRWGLMEVQPGQVNWSGVPVLLYPGAVRLWLWTAFAHGAEFITTYRYRQPRFGTELFHHGLVGTDGVTPSAGGREFMQVIDEMKRLQAAEEQLAHAPTPAAVPAAAPAPPPAPTKRGATAAARAVKSAVQTQIGLMFDFDQFWMYQALKQARRWNQVEWIRSWYAAAARLGLSIKVLHPDRDIPGNLPMVIAPGLQMVEEALVKRWDAYASGGGNLLLTCRTALMDRTGQLWEGPMAAPILPLIGATIEAYDGLPDDSFGAIELEGSTTRHKWGVWGDLLYAEPTTKVLAKYADQFYAGAAAVTRAKRNKGTVTYCGVCAEPSFIEALLERVARDAGIAVNVLPPRVHLIQRGGHHILLNYQDKPVQAPAPRTAKWIIGSATVEPAGVAVWEE